MIFWILSSAAESGVFETPFTTRDEIGRRIQAHIFIGNDAKIVEQAINSFWTDYVITLTAHEKHGQQLLSLETWPCLFLFLSLFLVIRKYIFSNLKNLRHYIKHFRMYST